MLTRLIRSRLERTAKRALLVTLLALALSTIVAPSAGLAFVDDPTVISLFLPTDGVGDSPLIP
jgi:hypothetical protein